MLADINPVTLSLVPIIGTLSLVFLSTYAMSRRSAKAQAARNDVERQKQAILQTDARLSQEFVDHIAKGITVDQATVQFQNDRSECLPTANPAAPHLWTIEQLETHCRELLRTTLEETNRSILVPAVAIALFVVAACTVAICVLYNFDSSPLATVVPAPSNDLPPLPPALPPQLPDALPPIAPVAPTAQPQTPDPPSSSPAPAAPQPKESESAPKTT